MIYISGIVISLFLSALLLFKKNKTKADNFLLSWILVVTIHQLYFYFNHSPLITQYTFLIGFDMPIPLMHGPFLFLYASALVGTIPKRSITWLAHFIPAIICYLFLIEFYALSGKQKLYIIENQGIGYELFLKLRFIGIVISGITYVVLTILLLRRHQKKIKDNFSDIEKINLKWLQFLNYGISGIWLTVIFGTDEITFIAVVIYVVFIGVYGIRQTPIFTSQNLKGELQFKNEPGEMLKQADELKATVSEYVGDPDELEAEKKSKENSAVSEATSDLNTVKEKYKKSGLNEHDLQLIHDRLADLMQKEKLYINPEITLGDVAQKLDIHPNYLSQAINSILKKNFYDYINFQRIEEFEKLVQDPKNQHFTLLSLAFGCGFNSKSSFNRNFRKVTGVSPTLYLNKIHVSLEEAE